ncbi:MAG TPA: cell division protein FtsZ, partial [Myxococcaceae bacterium]|nr:cell division protein FtsZ [Myxococcaceae bacterium]
MDQNDHKAAAKIRVVGVGGAGCNAVNTMIAANLERVDFIAANTDIQALAASRASGKIQIGTTLTKGLGALTVGVVTKPFLFEGNKRRKQAEQGLVELKAAVDTLITIPNQRLLTLSNQAMPLLETFKRADEVLLNAVQGISDLIQYHGYINVDFADVKTIMSD